MSPKIKQPENNRNELSLLELNNRIKEVLHTSFQDTYWVRAEMSDVRVNSSSGHCYLEFIEKNGITNQLVARVRGSIWARTFRILKPYFEMETGQTFSSGLKVLVKVLVEFHELYGFSLSVLDIDPTYTIGDMMRKKMEIIHQLQQEGVFTLNKELELPLLSTRIAVITSPTAAGYEDFLDQLQHNKSGYPFYIKLFPAIMQGEKTESSIIQALENVYQKIEHFDVVVIIRGGGATSDLNCFDSYLLAANCAQFPLPIVTGIGHERDDTIVDLVAHTRMKTPTAVAEFLIHRMDLVAIELDEIQRKVETLTTHILQSKKEYLQQVISRLPFSVLQCVESYRSQLQSIGSYFPVVAFNRLSAEQTNLVSLQNRLSRSVNNRLSEGKQFIQLTDQYIKMASPEYILAKGYSLTLKNGRIIKNASEIESGDELLTRFKDGEVYSTVTDNKKRQNGKKGRNI